MGFLVAFIGASLTFTFLVLSVCFLCFKSFFNSSDYEYPKPVGKIKLKFKDWLNYYNINEKSWRINEDDKRLFFLNYSKTDWFDRPEKIQINFSLISFIQYYRWLKQREKQEEKEKNLKIAKTVLTGIQKDIDKLKEQALNQINQSNKMQEDWAKKIKKEKKKGIKLTLEPEKKDFKELLEKETEKEVNRITYRNDNYFNNIGVYESPEKYSDLENSNISSGGLGGQGNIKVIAEYLNGAIVYTFPNDYKICKVDDGTFIPIKLKEKQDDC